MLRYRIVTLLMKYMLEGDRLVKGEINIPSSNWEWVEGNLGRIEWRIPNRR